VKTASCVGGPVSGSSDGQLAHLVAVLVCDATGPLAELRAGPFEPVVAVSESAFRQELEAHVVLRVRRGDEDRAWPRDREYGVFERGQARLVDMLDDLHEHSGVVAGQRRIRVGQCGLAKGDAGACLLRELIELQPTCAVFKAVQETCKDVS
jgi:hypothetical protein